MTTGVSGKTELDYLIPELWSPVMYSELRNSLILGSAFNRDYEGVINQMGDKVKVQQILAPTGEILTDDKATFNPESLTVSNFEVTVNSRAVASFEFTSLAQLQSLQFEQEAQTALVYAVQKQIESQILAAMIPSASTPDHQIAPASASDLAAADVASLRTLLSVAKVPRNNRWLVLDPGYYGDLLNKTTFTSQDFISGSSTISSGEFNSPLYGFRVIEHDLLSADTGFAFHPSALTLVIQQGMNIQISNQHVNKKFGYILSADVVFGLSLFDNKRLAKISG